MKKLYIDKYLTITLLNDNYYMVETISGIFKGYYKKMNKNTYEMRLDYWKDKKTNRLKGEKNKLYNHTCKWFTYIIEKYTKEAEI